MFVFTAAWLGVVRLVTDKEPLNALEIPEILLTRDTTSLAKVPLLMALVRLLNTEVALLVGVVTVYSTRTDPALNVTSTALVAIPHALAMLAMTCVEIDAFMLLVSALKSSPASVMLPEVVVIGVPGATAAPVVVVVPIAPIASDDAAKYLTKSIVMAITGILNGLEVSLQIRTHDTSSSRTSRES